MSEKSYKKTKSIHLFLSTVFFAEQVWKLARANVGVYSRQSCDMNIYIAKLAIGYTNSVVKV